MNNIAKSMETDSVTISKGNDGIIRSVYKQDVIITIVELKNNLDVIKKMGVGNKSICLVDISLANSISKEARDYYSSDVPSSFIEVVALIVGSPVSKVIGNFMLGINKPKFSIEMFTNPQKAIEWLGTFKNE